MDKTKPELDLQQDGGRAMTTATGQARHGIEPAIVCQTLRSLR